MPESLCTQLDDLCADEPPIDDESLEPPLHLERYKQLIEPLESQHEISNGLAYQFTELENPSIGVIALSEGMSHLLQDSFVDLRSELATWQPFVALVKGGKAVSVCRSARISPEAHEAGVETLPEFRGNGYAKDVVLEWARLVRSTGAIPLYSTSFENLASQAVARKLKLACYGATFGIA